MLFIVDDVKDEKFIRVMSESIINAHFLLTSRNQFIGENSVCLKCFTPEESIDYLRKRLPEHSHAYEALNKLRETLHDYPLALAQASSYIRIFPSLSLEDYIIYTNKRESPFGKKKRSLRFKKAMHLCHWKITTIQFLQLLRFFWST